MAKNLKRRYGTGNLHFITFSCYRRLPFLRTERARNVFLIVLNEVRGRYPFAIIGYVVMPEHVHLLLSEPAKRDPSVVIQVLKQRVSRRLRRRIRARTSNRQLRFWDEGSRTAHRSFWQRRFYDFNVWSRKKRTEKLHYMHMNPVKRGLVTDAKLWPWSSYRFY
ncbi:MAG: transposase, partial [Candidatus Acidiferrales bacterium]